MRKPLLSVLFTGVFYLIQVCVMPYFPINGVYGNLLMAWLAVVTVSLGKKYTFWYSMLYGILLESTQSNVPGIYLVTYPAAAMLFSLIFADMSEKTREERLSAGKGRTTERPALLRILLCALCEDALLHTVMIAYVTLNGSPLTIQMCLRALQGIVLTLAATLVIMLPCRAAMGIVKRGPRLKEETAE